MRISVWSSDVCSSYLAINGLREIDPDTSAIVIRIFTEYAAGRSARQIAEDLNKDRIATPSGASWQVNTIDRKSVVLGESLSVRVDIGGRRLIEKTKEP